MRWRDAGRGPGLGRGALDALDRLAPGPFDLVFVENIGNLVCAADSDLGADANVVLLGVPEGDDKTRKYPLIFVTSDVRVVTKTDYLPISDFDLGAATASTPGARGSSTASKPGDGGTFVA